MTPSPTLCATRTMIYLHTLGDSLITVGEKDIRPTAPLVFAALLYLGMERGRRVPRTALQELLFPKSDERSGAHSLRQLLYKLRQLGAPIEVDTTTASIRPEHVSDDSTAELSVTNGHLAGIALGFLPDYEPRLSDRYDEWVENRRASVAAHIRRQLVAAMSKSREALKWADVDRFAHLILAIDPLNEEATLALAESTALSGSKVEAVGILTRYEVETGRRDLRLPSSLLRRRISESAPEIRSSFRTPFVGREADAEAVHHQIQLARRGEPSLLVLAGEAGIGKTRLLEEVAGLAMLEGMLVHTVRCQSHYASRPLSVFIELVPALLSSRGALGVSPQSLAFLNLLTSHDDDRGDRPTDARDDVSRSSVLLAALRDLVDAVAAETPLVIAVEDAHWADADSLHELHGLVQPSSKRSLIVVYTTRMVDSLQRVATIDDDTIVRRLKPLDDGSMAVLARRLLPDNTSDDGALAAWCTETAAGNPFFLQMLCAHYAATGQPFTVPPDLISATTRRIERLSQECRRVLEFSALLGRHSTIESLRLVTESTQLQLLNAVQRLEEGGYLQMRGDAARVSHDLLSECTLNLVQPVARRVLHSCVATNLEQRYDSTRDASLLWDCAEHWVLSGETGKALEFLKRCAQHASHMGKASQALSLLERAKQLVRYPTELADVLGEMMITAKAAGQWADVYRGSKELARLATDDGDATIHTPLELLSIEAHWAMHQEGGIAQLVRCVSATPASNTHRLDASLLLLRLAQELCDSELAARTFASVESLLDGRSSDYSNRLVPIIYQTTFGDSDLGLHLARKLRDELDSVHPFADRIRAAINVSTALSLLGATSEAVAVAEEYYEITKSLGLIGRHREFCSYLCNIYLFVEDYEKAESWYARIDGNAQLDKLTAKRESGEAFELALWKRDSDWASKTLAQLGEASVGESLRGRAYYLASQIRVQQLNPGFVCDNDALKEMREFYESTKRFLSGDTLVVALGEALRRRGQYNELRALLDDYLGSARRERTSPPPSLVTLLTSIEGARQ